ncbi:hypothetical protein Csa_002098 [Cucumis sativus]|uniref:Uncharacterized protein n=1 Tax=Cucumis sativus TaxID=3659 RepID=A0A0A0LEP2_CUCSA|nr:hypothetical protein Csa_002098 [Cucumis sativus]
MLPKINDSFNSEIGLKERVGVDGGGIQRGARVKSQAVESRKLLEKEGTNQGDDQGKDHGIHKGVVSRRSLADEVNVEIL